MTEIQPKKSAVLDAPSITHAVVDNEERQSHLNFPSFHRRLRDYGEEDQDRYRLSTAFKKTLFTSIYF